MSMYFILIIVIALVFVAIIFRLKGKRKISYIIIIISIIVIGIAVCYSNVLKEEAKDRYRYIGFMDDSEVKLYNEQFTQYAGENVKGTYVQALIKVVLVNNVERDNDEFMKVSISGVVTLNKEDTQLPEQYNEISNEKTYNVKMNYN